MAFIVCALPAAVGLAMLFWIAAFGGAALAAPEMDELARSFSALSSAASARLASKPNVMNIP
jgi:hypothetical protein